MRKLLLLFWLAAAVPALTGAEVVFSRTFVGNGTDSVANVATDPEGNVYLLLTAGSTNLGGSALKRPSAGKQDALVIKLDRAGNIVYATYVGGSEDETARAIAVDASGSVFLIGQTTSKNLPVTTGAAQRQPGAGQDGFAARLSPAGDRLIYCTYLGGAGADTVSSLDIDAAGNAYLAGTTASPDFPVTPGAAIPRLLGATDAFVTKLNPEGTAFVYSTFLGGTADDNGSSVAVNAAGYAFVTGYTASTNFPVTPGAIQPVNRGQRDIFLAVLAPDGKSLLYGTYFGGQADEYAHSIILGGEGAAFVAGSTMSRDFPAKPPGPAFPAGLVIDGFVARFDFSGLTVLPAVASRLETALADITPDVEGGEHPVAPLDAGLNFAVRLLGDGNNIAADLAWTRDVFSLLEFLRVLELPRSLSSAPPAVHTFNANTGEKIATATSDVSVQDICQSWDGMLFQVGQKDGRATVVATQNGADQRPVAGNNGTRNDPVSTATGELFDAESDIFLGGAPGLGFARYYGSLLVANGITSALGANWMHNFDQRLVLTGVRATVLLFGGRTVAFERTAAGFRPLGAHRHHYQLVAAGSDFRFLDPAAGRIYTFNSSGALTRIEDRNGNALTITPSTQGPLRVADGLGRSLTFAYTGSRLSSVQDQTGRRILFQHSGSDLTRFIDAAGKTTEYSYTAAGGMGGLVTARRLPLGNRPYTQTFDAEGRVRTQSDSRGNAATFEYHRPAPFTTTITEPLGVSYRHTHSGPNNLTQIVDAAGQSASFTYDAAQRRTRTTDRMGDATTATFHEPSGFPATYTDAEGNTTTYSYSSQVQGAFTYYNLARTGYPDGSSVSFSYDAAGNPLTMTDRAGKVWRMTYNSRGQLETLTNPAGGLTRYAYNQDATLVSVELASGDTTTFAYDAKKRLAKVTHPDGATQEFGYDDRDSLVRFADERGNTYQLAYDDNGRLTRVTDPENAAASFGYDALDRVTAISDSLGERAGIAYDAEGVPISLRDAAGGVWQFRSNKLGRMVEARTPLGNTYAYTYDRMGRLTSAADPLGRTARLSYDSRGLLTALNLPGEISTAWQRNDLGAVSAVTDANGNVWRRHFDSMGRVVGSTDPLGRQRAVAYDQRQQVSGVRTPEGDVRFEYDAAGNLLRRLYWDGAELSYSYDVHNRLVKADNLSLAYDANGRIRNSNGLEITRDAAGRIATITLAPGKTVTYTYDQAGMLASVADWQGGMLEFRYDRGRRPSEIARQNGVTTRYTYDGDGRIATIEESRDGVLASLSLTRDAAGRIVSAERNLPVALELEAGGQTYVYDAANQLEGATYDGLGRMVADGTRSFVWDAASRLASVKTPEGTTNYTYDGLGLLVGRGEETFVRNYALGLGSISVVR